MNIIFSPGRTFSTSGPTSSTIPTPSFPGMLGRVILTGYFPKNQNIKILELLHNYYPLGFYIKLLGPTPHAIFKNYELVTLQMHCLQSNLHFEHCLR